MRSTEKAFKSNWIVIQSGNPDFYLHIVYISNEFFFVVVAVVFVAQERKLYLVSSRQSGPGLVRSPVIVLSFGYFDVVTEADEDLAVA